MQYVQSDLLKYADNQSSLKTNMLQELEHTGLGNNSLELTFPQKFPLTSVFDFGPRKYHVFFSSNNINHDIEKLMKDQKTDFVLKLLRAWLKDPSTPKPQRKKPTITGNKALSHFFERFELLQ